MAVSSCRRSDRQSHLVEHGTVHCESGDQPCVCSGNFNHVDECDNTLTTATVAKGFYTNHEDCDLEWSETVELAVPYFFQTESG